MARSSKPSPTRPSPPASKQLITSTEMRRGVERLRERLSELESFPVGAITSGTPPEITGLQVAINNTLERIFGADTADFRRFAPACKIQWSPGFAIGNYPALQDYKDGIKENIGHATAILGEAIRALEEEISDTASSVTAAASLKINQERDLTKVFIVHGHDGEARQTVARFIEKIGFEAIILHERPNKGRTIITKFREEAAGVGFAVVLMTPDDVGGPVSSAAAGHRPRARQNVVFELGFFIGELGADRVAALIKGDVERPSDFDGVVYISLDASGWQMELGRELKAAGYSVDWNKVMG